ncbi:TonB-dependent receptor [Halosquirtibacter laminarini]|uniref:TonB-dependent receptor n=2 Tax=Halosquirtibacter laminarini TaxID=3374600 RepID=A0AC61NLU4_9BACT|nr:TonB-dependent receptor [Prolixibacteraceae bacterium]
MVAGAVTNYEGEFELKTDIGSYILEITSIGYKKYQHSFHIEQNLYLGTILLKEDIHSLSEVTIKKRRKVLETKVDRMIYKVLKEPMNEGKDGLEILNNVPGVLANQEGLSVVTKSNYKLYINNRELKLTKAEILIYLQGLNASEIDRIEVITSPPAKYGSEGDFCVIKVITKKENNHINVHARGSVSYANEPYYKGGAAITLQAGRWTLSSNAGFQRGTKEPTQRYQIYYPNYLWDELSEDIQKSSQYSLYNEVTYQCNDKIELGVTYAITSSDPTFKSKNSSNIKGLDNKTDSIIIVRNNFEKERDSKVLGAYADIQLDTLGKAIHLCFDYLDYDITNQSKYVSETIIFPFSPYSFKRLRNSSFLYATIKNGQVDVSLPFSWLDLELGSKYSVISNKNGVEYDSNKLNENNSYDYDEQNFALYGSFSKKITSRLDIKAGIRSETTHYKQQNETLKKSNEKSVTKLFPSLYIKYRSPKGNALFANYQRRVDRPSFRLLDPYRFYTTPYNYSEGNPFLENYFTSIYTGGIAMQHMNLSMSYYHITNKYDEVTFVNDQTAVQVVRPENFYDMDRFQLYLNMNYGIKKWYKGSLDMLGLYSQTKSKIPKVVPSLSSYTGIFVSNNTIMIPHTGIVFDISYLYSSPSLAGSYEVSSYSQCDVGASIMMFHKSLRFQVDYSDLFDSTDKTFTQYVHGIKQVNWDHMDIQRIRFALSYSLNNKFKKKHREDISIDQKNRL